MKKLRERYPSQIGKNVVERINFEPAEVEKLELIKSHLGLGQNTETIKALIAEKCEAIKLAEESRRKRQIEEAKALEYLEKGKYTFPMYE